MSEYQYYEFRAIDRALSDEEMGALRQITSRAEITRYSLVNEYQWGDFKGDARQMMRSCFDAHLYWANWGAGKLWLSLPGVPIDLLRPYVNDESVILASAARERPVVCLADTSEEPPEEYFEFTLSEFLPIRDAVTAGDLRPLYLGWLAGAWMVNKRAAAPPVPPGLGELPPAMQKLVELLQVDPDALAVAAARSGPTQDHDAARVARLRTWVKTVEPSVKDDWLVRLASGEGPGVRVEINHRFTTDVPPAKRTTGEGTVNEVLAAAETHRRARLGREAAERTAEEARLEREAALARERRLEDLARRFSHHWSKVHELIDRKQAKSYAEAVALMRDLLDAGDRHGKLDDAMRRIAEVRARYPNRSSLMARMSDAGLP